MIHPERNWWYGPKNPVNLSDICQAGATAIATALHEVPEEEVWANEAIPDRKKRIEHSHNVILSKAGCLPWRTMLLQVFFFTYLVQSIARRQQQDLLTTANDRSTGLSQLHSRCLSLLSLKRLAETEAKRYPVKQKRLINT